MPNTGTLSGLSAATAYVLDAVHVDATGNISNVETSEPFTTATAPATQIVYEGAGDLGTGISATVANGVSTAGFHVLCVFNDDPNTTPATVTFSGASPDGVVSSANGQGGNVELHHIANAAPGDIAITTTDASRAKSYALYRLTGFTAAGLISADDEGQGPITLGSVPDGAAILVAGGAASGSGAGLPVITATDTIQDGGHAGFPALTVNSGTKAGAGSVTASLTGGANRFGLVGLAFPVA